MARVELAEAAVADLDRLIRSHSLPRNTRQRVRRALTPLRTFPRIGTELPGRWRGLRFLLGPWRWMPIVYTVEDEDRVVVVTIQDGRSSAAATAER